MRPSVKELLGVEAMGQDATVMGWVRTKRQTKSATFVEVNDGSCMANIQCVFDAETAGRPEVASALEKATTGASVAVKGSLIPSPAAGQKAELRGAAIEVIGEAAADSYPLQKKAHSLEFLREIAHLRPRTNTFGAVARVRNRMAFAVHQFFQERGFSYIHTPIITASDAEGAGAMFQVTTLDLEKNRLLGRRGLRLRFLRQAGFPHGLRPAQRGNLLPGPGKGLYLRPHIPG